MDRKKEQILHSAMKFFSEKGYYSTSVQEIAKDCGISKGSLYKYFQSKEELFIEIFEYFQNKMFEKVNHIEFEQELGKKEKLELKILVQLEDFINKKDFIMLQFKELPIQNNKELIPLLHRSRTRMLNWHRRNLEEAYGEKIKGYIWDIVVLYQGIMKEFLMLMTNKNVNIPLEKLAKSIVKRMDGVVDSYEEDESSLLTENMMRGLTNIEAINGEKLQKKQLGQVLGELKNSIEETRGNKKHKAELRSAVSLLEEELFKEQPKIFLVKALISFLEKEAELKGYIYQIERMIENNAQ